MKKLYAFSVFRQWDKKGRYVFTRQDLSKLSEYGLISQIPIDRLTVMTTGRKGIFKTQYSHANSAV